MEQKRQPDAGRDGPIQGAAAGILCARRPDRRRLPGTGHSPGYGGGQVSVRNLVTVLDIPIFSRHPHVGCKPQEFILHATMNAFRQVFIAAVNCAYLCFAFSS